MINSVTINGEQRSYVGDPIGTYMCQIYKPDGNKSYGGRDNFGTSNSSPALMLTDIVNAFAWQNQWKYLSDKKDGDMERVYGYVVDYGTGTLYYDSEDMFGDEDFCSFMDWEVKLLHRVKIDGYWEGEQLKKIVYKPTRSDFDAILERKRQGIDCTEEESAIMKMIFKEISYYFQTEAYEAMDEMPEYELERSRENKVKFV